MIGNDPAIDQLQDSVDDLRLRLSILELRRTPGPNYGAARDDSYEEGTQTNKIVSPQGRLQVRNIVNLTDLSTYASDAAAGAGGLIQGDLYKDAAGGVHVKL